MGVLESQDPEVAAIIEHEANRQRGGIELIASENLMSRAVMEAGVLMVCVINRILF